MNLVHQQQQQGWQGTSRLYRSVLLPSSEKIKPELATGDSDICKAWVTKGLRMH